FCSPLSSNNSNLNVISWNTNCSISNLSCLE
ncbi:MAG: hypothetical protein ACI94Y_003741, partial [Maribacter sp.]